LHLNCNFYKPEAIFLGGNCPRGYYLGAISQGAIVVAILPGAVFQGTVIQNNKSVTQIISMLAIIGSSFSNKM